MIEISKLTDQDKRFLEGLKTQGVSAEEAFNRLNIVHEKLGINKPVQKDATNAQAVEQQPQQVQTPQQQSKGSQTISQAVSTASKLRSAEEQGMDVPFMEKVGVASQLVQGIGQKAIEGVKDILPERVTSAIEGVASPITGAYEAGKELQQGFVGLAKNIVQPEGTQQERVSNIMENVGEVGVGTAGALWNTLATIPSATIGGILGAFKPEVQDAIKGLTETQAYKYLQNEFSKLPEESQKAVSQSARIIGDTLGLKATSAVSGVAENVATQAVKTGESVAKGAENIAKSAVNTAETAFNAVRDKISKVGTNNATKEIEDALSKRAINTFQAEQLAKEYGVELLASATAGPVISKLEQFGAQSLGGGELLAKAERAVESFVNATDRITAKAPKHWELGENIVKTFKEVESQRKTVIDALYDSAEEMIKNGKTVYVDAKNTLDELSNMIKMKELSAASSKGEVNFIQRLRDGLSNTNLDVQRATLKDIGMKANFDSIDPTTMEKLYRRLYGTLKRDIDSSIEAQLPELAPVLQKANAKYAELAKIKERPFAKTIAKLGKAGDVDTVANKLTSAKVSQNEIKSIYNVLGENTKKQIQERMIADIIEKAKSTTGQGFTPAGFAKQIKDIGEEKLKAVLTPQQLETLYQLDELNKLVSKSFEVSKGSQTALLQNLSGTLNAVGLAFTATTGGASLLLTLGNIGLAKLAGTELGQAVLKGLTPAKRKLLEEAMKKAKENIAETMSNEGVKNLAKNINSNGEIIFSPYRGKALNKGEVFTASPFPDRTIKANNGKLNIEELTKFMRENYDLLSQRDYSIRARKDGNETLLEVIATTKNKKDIENIAQKYSAEVEQ